MKRKLIFRFTLSLALICLATFGCGSSTTDSGTSYKEVTSDEYAYVTRDDILNDNIVVIDTENSSTSCDSSGGNCYRFATRYYKIGSQTNVGVIDSSGHRIFFEFISTISGNRIYEYVSGTEFTSQSLRMYVSYDSPELSCGESCANVYNWSDTVTCNPATSTCRYYRVTILENSDETLEFVFRIWNGYFLDSDEVPPEGDRGAVFEGQIKIKKSLHGGTDNYYHVDEDE